MFMKKGEIQKARIIECAQQMFAAKGYYETQIFDIAKLAKIAKGTIYQYFKNKEDIFITLMNIYLNEWKLEALDGINDYRNNRQAASSNGNTIWYMIYRTLSFFIKDHERSKIILRMGPGLNEEIEPIVRLFEDNVMRIVIQEIKFGQEQGYIDHNIDIEISANVIMGAVFRTCYYYFIQNHDSQNKLQLKTVTDEVTKITENLLNIRNNRTRKNTVPAEYVMN